MVQPHFIPHTNYCEYPLGEMHKRANDFYLDMKRRRTVRDFADSPVPRGIIETCIRTAGTTVSGANMQPWQFVAISDARIKSKIRIGAEKEEREFYQKKAPQEWLDALAPLGTDADKPFIETAPWLIAIFQKRYGLLPDGRKVKHYYATESVGIATGLLIAAVHNAGLVSLTHTPSPMGFLNTILERPRSERPFLLLVVGYPADNAMVPDISKKPLDEIATFL